MDTSFDQLEKDIEQIKDEFYGSSGKNLFFKKQQKFDCATQIMTRLPLELLLRKTCRILPEHRLVYIDYTILKSYATPEVFDHITDYIIHVFHNFNAEYGFLEVALNLDTFTVSAAERYKSIITIFCDKCFQHQTGFSNILTKFSVYNIPRTFDAMLPALIPLVIDEVKAKVRLHNKAESEPILRQFGI